MAFDGHRKRQVHLERPGESRPRKPVWAAGCRRCRFVRWRVDDEHRFARQVGGIALHLFQRRRRPEFDRGRGFAPGNKAHQDECGNGSGQGLRQGHAPKVVQLAHALDLPARGLRQIDDIAAEWRMASGSCGRLRAATASPAGSTRSCAIPGQPAGAVRARGRGAWPSAAASAGPARRRARAGR